MRSSSVEPGGSGQTIVRHLAMEGIDVTVIESFPEQAW